MRIFVIGASRNRLWIRTLIESLQMRGHIVFDWTRHGGWDDPDYDPSQVAQDDLAELLTSDGALWVLDDTPSHGAPFEAGVCWARDIPLVVFWRDGVKHQHLIYGHDIAGFRCFTQAVRNLESFIRERQSAAS